MLALLRIVKLSPTRSEWAPRTVRCSTCTTHRVGRARSHQPGPVRMLVVSPHAVHPVCVYVRDECVLDTSICYICYICASAHERTCAHLYVVVDVRVARDYIAQFINESWNVCAYVCATTYYSPSVFFCMCAAHLAQHTLTRVCVRACVRASERASERCQRFSCSRPRGKVCSTV